MFGSASVLIKLQETIYSVLVVARNVTDAVTTKLKGNFLVPTPLHTIFFRLSPTPLEAISFGIAHLKSHQPPLIKNERFLTTKSSFAYDHEQCFHVHTTRTVWLRKNTWLCSSFLFFYFPHINGKGNGQTLDCEEQKCMRREKVDA